MMTFTKLYKRVVVGCVATLAVVLVGSFLAVNSLPSSALSTLWNGTVATSYASGSGTSASPWVISTAEQLARMRQEINAGRGNASSNYYILGDDILLNNTGGTMTWTPIGVSNYFYANFDGKGKTIYGVYNNGSYDVNGLFGYVGSATIKNVTLAEGYIKGRTAGMLAGEVSGATITNCHTKGSVLGMSGTNGTAGANTTLGNDARDGQNGGTVYIGGMFGYFSGGSITDSSNACAVTGSSGGSGGNGGNCTSALKGYSGGRGGDGGHGGDSYTGGISGYLGGTVSNTRNTGAVTGSSGGSGGIGGNGYLAGAADSGGYDGNDGGDGGRGGDGGNSFAGGIAGVLGGTITGSSNSVKITGGSGGAGSSGGTAGKGTAASSQSGYGFSGGSGGYGGDGGDGGASWTGGLVGVGGTIINSNNSGAVVGNSGASGGPGRDGVQGGNGYGTGGWWGHGGNGGDGGSGGPSYAGGISGQGSAVWNSYNTSSVNGGSGGSGNTGGIGAAGLNGTGTDQTGGDGGEGGSGGDGGSTYVGGIVGSVTSNVVNNYNSGAVTGGNGGYGGYGSAGGKGGNAGSTEKAGTPGYAGNGGYGGRGGNVYVGGVIGNGTTATNNYNRGNASGGTVGAGRSGGSAGATGSGYWGPYPGSAGATGATGVAYRGGSVGYGNTAYSHYLRVSGSTNNGLNATGYGNATNCSIFDTSGTGTSITIGGRTSNNLTQTLNHWVAAPTVAAPSGVTYFLWKNNYPIFSTSPMCNLTANPTANGQVSVNSGAMAAVNTSQTTTYIGADVLFTFKAITGFEITRATVTMGGTTTNLNAPNTTYSAPAAYTTLANVFSYKTWHTASDKTTLNLIINEPFGALSVSIQSAASVFTITYNLNGGGTVSPANKAIAYGSTTSLDVPIRPGYDFDGWFDTIANANANNSNGRITTATGILNTANNVTNYTTSGKWSTTTARTVYARWVQVVFIVVYDMNGCGIAPEDILHTIGTDTSLEGVLPQGVIDLQNFLGWSLTKGGEIVTSIPAATIAPQIWANWGYIAHLNNNGGEGGTESIEVVSGADMPLVDMPTREGYTLLGFFDTISPTGGTQYYTGTGESAHDWDKLSDSILWARWSANKYTINLDKNGGLGGNSSVIAVYDSVLPKLTALPSLEGYFFKGYFDTMEETGGRQYYTAAGESNYIWDIADNTTLWARWSLIGEFNLFFDTMGGSTINPVRFSTIEENLVEFRPVDPTRMGYIFAGWYKDELLTTTFDFRDPVPRTHTTIYADWMLRTSLITLDNYGVLTFFEYTYGEPYPDAPPADLTLKDHYFDGWFYLQEKIDETNWETFLDNLTSNVILYTSFTPYPIITLISNGVTIGSIIIPPETDLVSLMPGIPARTGYAFGGWYREAIFANLFSFEDDAIPTRNLNLYAKWDAKKYTVIYNFAGGSHPTATESIAEWGQHFVFAVPARLHYNFAGWVTMDGKQLTYDTGNSRNYWNIDSSTGEVEVRAYWIPVDYTIRFNADGGTATPSVSFGYGEQISTIMIPLNPTKEFALFIGWYTPEGVEFNFHKDTMPADGVMLTAKWAADVSLLRSLVNNLGIYLENPDNIEYDAKLYQRFLSALDNANEVLETSAPTVDQVRTAFINLTDAVTALENGPDENVSLAGLLLVIGSLLLLSGDGVVVLLALKKRKEIENQVQSESKTEKETKVELESKAESKTKKATEVKSAEVETESSRSTDVSSSRTRKKINTGKQFD